MTDKNNPTTLEQQQDAALDKQIDNIADLEEHLDDFAEVMQDHAPDFDKELEELVPTLSDEAATVMMEQELFPLDPHRHHGTFVSNTGAPKKIGGVETNLFLMDDPGHHGTFVSGPYDTRIHISRYLNENGSLTLVGALRHIFWSAWYGLRRGLVWLVDPDDHEFLEHIERLKVARLAGL